MLASAFAFVQMLLQAAAMRGQLLSGSTLAPSLTGFSLGLFGAQVAMVAAALPMARRIHAPQFWRAVMSVVVAALAVHWLVARTSVG